MLTQAADKKATQALILSCLGFVCCGIMSIVGIVMGLQSKRELEAAGRTETGKSLAAIIIGAIMVILNVAGIAFQLAHR